MILTVIVTTLLLFLEVLFVIELESVFLQIWELYPFVTLVEDLISFIFKYLLA